MKIKTYIGVVYGLFPPDNSSPITELSFRL